MGMAEDDTNNDEPINRVRHPATEPQIAEVLALVGEVLGPDVLGAYLHGSAVLGGLRPRSDIDILVVSRRPSRPTSERRPR